MMKCRVNKENKLLLDITLLVINLLLLINDWSNHAFAGTIDLNANSINKMTGLDLASNNELKDSTQPTGFLWYNEDLLQTKEVIKLDSVAAKQDFTESAYDHRINKLKREFSQAKCRALDNPTLVNIITAQRLHKQILEKSYKFATMWQLATLLDYSLTNENIPANSLHKKLYEIRQDKDSSQKLRFLAKNWGLIMQVNQGCEYCHAFASHCTRICK